MTPTIIFWVRLGILSLLGYTIFNHLRSAHQRGYLWPRHRADWKCILNDGITLVATGVALFMLERNYQAPMDAVLKKGMFDIGELTCQDIRNGQQLTLADFKGKVVVLNIWATWCPPCRRELPDLNALQQTFGPDELAVIALSDENIHTVTEFIQDKKYAFTTAIFTRMPASMAQVGTRPVSILIDRNGVIREMVVGARGIRFFTDWVKPLLAPTTQ